VGYNSAPAFADLDGDGDLDAFIGEFFGTTQYFENTGTTTSPAFDAASANPFGLSDVGYSSVPTFADLDGDGDLDAFIGERFDDTFYFENTGTPVSPAFATPTANPFGLARVDQESTPTFADVDGDGDLDAFIGQRDGNTQYFKNKGTATSPSFAVPETNPFGLTDVGAYNQPAFADLDGDGDLDAYYGEQNGETKFFENIAIDLSVGLATFPALPTTVELDQNYPNPFSANTEIVYTLPNAGHVRLVIYDVRGREVARLVDGRQGAGEHRVPWMAEGLPSGLYVYRLETGQTAQTRTMMLVR